MHGYLGYADGLNIEVRGQSRPTFLATVESHHPGEAPDVPCPDGATQTGHDDTHGASELDGFAITIITSLELTVANRNQHSNILSF